VGEGAALCVDSYNLATADVVFSELELIPANKIAIAQIADRDPGSPWRALPAEGDLDLPGFVDALAASDYDGALSVETFPQRPRGDGHDYRPRCPAKGLSSSRGRSGHPYRRPGYRQHQALRVRLQLNNRLATFLARQAVGVNHYGGA
jgi:hypothetical protein